MPADARSRKPAHAAARAEGAKLNHTPHHPVFDPIITMNAEGIIQSASAAVEQVFGWTPTELFGRNLKVLIPEPRRSDLDRYLDRYRRADRTKTLTRMRRFDAVRKDGSLLEIELSVSRAELPPHAAPFFVGLIRDVSSQIDVSGDSPEARSKLQQLITEQTRALATANLRLHLADRLASIGTLAAGLGHDINNVLLPVRARLDALEHTEINTAARSHVTAVRRSIAYLQRLSDGLHFLALDPDSPTAADEGDGATDLSQWWSQVGPLLRSAVPKHVKLRATLPAQLPMIAIAPHWLTQAVLNLIVNAGEAIPRARRGGRVHVWANSAAGGKSVRVGVTDNGIGMTSAVQRQALDLFFTTKPRSMGTGLGLPLARKVAVRAGGAIEMRSEPSRGTSVVLVLPAITRRRATGLRGQASRSAMISIRDSRTADLISQVLVKTGLKVNAGVSGPGNADLWVTEPTSGALAAAVRWRSRLNTRTVVLLGVPSARTKAAWNTLAATIINPTDDFSVIRKALGQALLRV